MVPRDWWPVLSVFAHVLLVVPLWCVVVVCEGGLFLEAPRIVLPGVSCSVDFSM